MKKSPRAALEARAKDIKLIGMDVDGVMTAGDIIVLNSGEEVKLWSSKDRLVIAMLRSAKDRPVLAWITGRSSKAVTYAADDLGIPHVIQDCKNKKKAMESLLRQHNLTFKQVAYIGDDLIDLPVLKAAGFSASPADAVEEVKDEVHYVSPLDGGKGVVRDVIRFILKAQKKWDPLIASLRD